jgi:hypothetical protein
VEYREIPICSGFDDEGRPIVEFVEWPFVLPHLLVTGQSVRCFLNYFHIKDLFPDKFIQIYIIQKPGYVQKTSGRCNDSERLPGCAGAVGQSGQLLASHAKRIS